MRKKKPCTHSKCWYTRLFIFGTAYGNRTHDSAVRGLRLDLLTKAADMVQGILEMSRTLLYTGQADLSSSFY